MDSEKNKEETDVQEVENKVGEVENKVQEPTNQEEEEEADVQEPTNQEEEEADVQEPTNQENLVEEPEIKEKKPTILQKAPKLLNQGSYGCIFKPPILCENDVDLNNENYVSKIQQKTKELEKEIQIGLEIQQIENYYYYYAPILNTCDVNITALDSKIIRGCKVIKNELGEIDKENEYVSNKIRYVGRYSFNKILQMISSGKKLAKLINSHLYLLKSMQLMLEKNIIHLDLKTDNIMWDDKQEIPIIIDFGLSFNIKKLLDENSTDNSSKESLYKNIFIGKEYYVFWCVDIFMICQIVNYYNNGDVEAAVLEIILKKMIEDKYFKILFTNDDIEIFKSKYNTFFEKYIGKPWKDLFKNLLDEKNYSTWDNYSLCTAIMFTLNDNRMMKSNDMNTQSYIKLIKEILLSMPGERIGIEETKQRILDITHSQPIEIIPESMQQKTPNA